MFIPKPPTYASPRKLPTNCWAPIPECKPVLLIDLESHHCRWPVDGGFCGWQKSFGISYCKLHKIVARHGQEGLKMIRADGPKPPVDAHR